MSFTLLPALDLAGGRVAGAETVDPISVALGWQASGATWIHLVDLDAAFGRGSNDDLLRQIIGALDIDVELSAGVSDDETVDSALATGCSRVNVTVASLADPGWCARAIAEHGERVAWSLDVVTADRGGAVEPCVRARGGGRFEIGLWEAIDQLDRAGCVRYVVTDVERDGALSGPDHELYRAVAAATSASVIASGGISSLDDLVALAALPGLDGAIMGKALHDGRFTVADALAAIRRVGRSTDPGGASL